MLHDASTGSPVSGRGLTRPHGVWEVLGILAAVIPCGILAGLYLATEDVRFILGCAVLATLAIVIIFMRSPRLRLPRRHAQAEGAGAGAAAKAVASERLAPVVGALRRTFTLQVLKLLGFALWMLAWGATAALYARVAENPNNAALVMLVIVGGFSPVVIYFGLETGIKKLTGRIRGRE